MLFFIFLFGVTAMVVADNKTPQALFTEANSQFSAKMLTEVAKANPGKSIVLSAFSTLSPLAQLGLASVGETHDQIFKITGLPNDNVTKIVFPIINNQLRSAKGIELKMSNGIYIQQEYELNDEFAGISKTVFESEVQKVNFLKDKETASYINEWVEQKTNHRIKDLVKPDSLTSDTRAVLVNAIYFKGNWLYDFDEKLTSERDFHVTKDKTVKLPTMFKSGTFAYTESVDLDAKILELPYQGYEAWFYIVLPNKIDGITNLMQKLKDPSVLPKAIKDLDEAKVDMWIPKFKIETTINLKDVLTKLGVKNLFEKGNARLDNLLIDAGELFVSEATQKAFIEINEVGAEAAAANDYVLSTRSFRKAVTTQFKADHPFYFFIMFKDDVLFSGRFAA